MWIKRRDYENLVALLREAQIGIAERDDEIKRLKARKPRAPKPKAE